MVEVDCRACGERFEAKTARSKYCSDRCKKRYHRGARADESTQDAEKADEARSGLGSTAAATLLTLQEAGRLGTPLAQAALVIAHRLDHSHTDTGAGVASLAKQLEATLTAATADADHSEDLVDELRAARERKRKRAVGE